MSAGDGRGAMARVVDELAARPEAEQLELVPVPTRQSDGRADLVRELVARHRAGRPPGARNLATRDALAFVRRVLGDPLIERARMAMHTPESLSMMLGCTKLEAAQFLDGIRADLQRLFYAPLAPVDGDGNAVVPTFSMTIGGAGGAETPGAKPWDYLTLVTEKTQQIQGFSEGAEPVSHAAVSHEGDK